MAGSLVDRHALSGDHRFIDRRDAGLHDPVDGNLLAGTDDDEIAEAHHIDGDIDLMTVADDPSVLRLEAGRARQYYDESRLLLELIHPRSKASLLALISIYSRLLDRIEGKNYDVFTSRVRLSAVEKSWILVRALIGRPLPSRRAASDT